MISPYRLLHAINDRAYPGDSSQLVTSRPEPRWAPRAGPLRPDRYRGSPCRQCPCPLVILTAGVGS